MKRVLVMAGAALLLLVSVPHFRAAARAAQDQAITQTNLKVGDTAPDFTLLSDKWQPVKLSDYRGKKNVILAFYVLAFTGG